MHLTVGYLAVDVVLVVRQEMPDGHPTRPGDVSLVSAENLAHAESAKQVREIQIAAAEENLVLAARSLPDAPEIESLVADGLTLESALKKLNWDDTDVRWWAPAGSRRRAGSFSALQRPASSPAPMPRSS